MAYSLPFNEVDGFVASGAQMQANLNMLLSAINALSSPSSITRSQLLNTTAGVFLGALSAGPVVDLTPAQATALLGLSNVANTSDANKPVSIAQQTALNLKADLASSPTFTGTVTANSDFIASRTGALTTGAYYFGNTGNKYLSSDGASFVLSGNAQFTVVGDITAHRGTAVGVYYFGNADQQNLSSDGTKFTFSAPLVVAGAVTAPNLPKNREVYSPMDYGAVGDGTTDDGAALNSMFAAVRTAVAADINRSITVTGGNKSYRTTISINATGMAPAWNLHIRDLYIIGACPTFAVLDLIGSRGYTLDNVSIWGDQTNPPAVGLQMQRGSAGGFCDNVALRKVFTDGYFTKACVHEYGMETVHWDHCAFYNRNNTGRVAIFEGFNGPTAMVSNGYASVMTGGTSHTNHRFTNCDFRYQPAGANVAAITGLTTGANAVVTAPGHAFVVGNQVTFGFVQGMALTQTAIGNVMAVTGSTVTTDVNTTGWGAYVAGGILVRRQTLPSVYISRCEGFSTESMYVVSYGQPHIELAFPDPGFTRMDNVRFDNILFEGSGINYEVIFTTGTTNVNVLGFTLTTYSAPHIVSLMEDNGTGIVSLYNPRIESVQPLFTGSLAGTPAKFGAYGAEILYDSLAAVAPTAWSNFNGKIVSIATGKNTLFVSDTINLFGNRTSFPGSFTQSGTAVPTLGSLKPGTSNSPVAWMDLAIDGTMYCFPVWPKT